MNPLILSDMFGNFGALLHQVVLVVWACILLIVDLFIPKRRKGLTALLAVLGLLTAIVVVIIRAAHLETAFNGMITLDGYAVFLNVLFLVAGILAIALAYDYLKQKGIERGEYYILLLFSIAGMVLMAQASDLIIVFLGLELLSIPLYVLAGFAVPRVESEEAALKYFLLGTFSTGIFVYGTALTFGATGTTSFSGIISTVTGNQANLGLLLVGAAFILISLGFKVAAVPFHMWTPDVYHGAPTSVTAFMSVGAKAAGFAALVRIFALAFPSQTTSLVPVLWILAAITMILGNLVAIAQSNIKRLLAYSSIAHAGYMLMALVSIGNDSLTLDAVASILVYLVAYTLTSFTAWAVVIAVETGGLVSAPGNKNSIDQFAGLGSKSPLLAAAMVVAMLSFTGIPPTLGFLGKFFVFRTALAGGFTWLAIIGVLTSLISAYYYLRVVAIMYMRPAVQDESEIIASPQPRLLWLNVAAGVTALGTILLSIFASPLFRWATQAVMKLF